MPRLLDAVRWETVPLDPLLDRVPHRRHELGVPAVAFHEAKQVVGLDAVPGQNPLPLRRLDLAAGALERRQAEVDVRGDEAVGRNDPGLGLRPANPGAAVPDHRERKDKERTAR